MILGRLQETLDHKITYKWQKRIAKTRGGILSCCKSPIKLIDLWIERLFVAMSIADAINYLHKHSIIYRDLKVSTSFFYHFSCLCLPNLNITEIDNSQIMWASILVSGNLISTISALFVLIIF